MSKHLVFAAMAAAFTLQAQTPSHAASGRPGWAFLTPDDILAIAAYAAAQ